MRYHDTLPGNHKVLDCLLVLLGCTAGRSSVFWLGPNTGSIVPIQTSQKEDTVIHTSVRHVWQQHKTSLDMFIWEEKSKKARLTVLACLVGCTIRCLTPTYHSSKQACISIKKCRERTKLLNIMNVNICITIYRTDESIESHGRIRRITRTNLMNRTDESDELHIRVGRNKKQ